MRMVSGTRSLILGLLLLFLAGASFALAPDRLSAQQEIEPVPGQLLVKFRKGASPDEAGRRHGVAVPDRALRARRDAAQGLDRWYTIRLPESADLADVATRLQADPDVERVEPNRILHVQLIPDDPYYASSDSWGQGLRDQWPLPRIGLVEVGSGSGWDVERDEGGAVVVAVIDTGIDAAHPDLQGNLWVNEDEIPGNGLDDDGNGLIDDVAGWDFVNNDNHPHDGHGHGTHCAGTIAARTHNGIGIAGISWGSRIMPLKGLSDGGSGEITGLANALAYAADNGAKILSNSWGGIGTSAVLEDAVAYARDAGCLVIAAAGNSDTDLDAAQFVPASIAGVLSVAAVDSNDVRAWFSNFGDSIAVSAPGVDVLSLRAAGTDMYGDGLHIVDTDYYRANGTSMACPHVAGIAALVWAYHLDWTAEEVRNQIVHTTDYIDPINPTYAGRLGSGRINARKALTTPPQPDLVVEAVEVAAPESFLANGAADRGEEAGLVVVLRNRWLTATGVTATLSTGDPLVDVVQAQTYFGTIDPSATGQCEPPLRITVAAAAPYGHPLGLVLHIEAEGGYQVDLPLPLRVSSPVITLRSAYVEDDAGNANGLLEPGETAGLRLDLLNRQGSALGEDIAAALVSLDPRIVIHQGDAAFGSIPPGASRTNLLTPCVVEMAADFPVGSTAALRLEIAGAHGYAATEDLELSPPGTIRTFWSVVGPGWPPLFLGTIGAAAGDDGSIHLAFGTIGPDSDGLHYGRWAGGFWTGPATIEPYRTDAFSTLLDVDSAGEPHLVWSESRLAPGWHPLPLMVSEIYYMQQVRTQWTPPRGMTDNWEIEALRGYALALDSLDRPHVAWLYMDWSQPNTLHWHHYVRDGGTWQSRLSIFESTDTQRGYTGFQLVPGPAGIVWLLWVRNPTGNEVLRQLYGMRWNGSAWSGPILLHEADYDLSYYEMVIDRQERMHLIIPDGNAQVRRYTVSLPGGMGWSPPIELASSGSFSARSSLFLDTDGLVYLGYNAGPEIRARVLEHGTWSEEETLLTLGSRDLVQSVRLLVDQRGHRHVLWNSIDNGVLGRVRHTIVEAYRLKPPPTPPPAPSMIELR